jgi:hypothetical protein
VKTIGAITKAIKNRIPGTKNLSGIEIFVKYVKLSATTAITRNAPIAISPEANAL